VSWFDGSSSMWWICSGEPFWPHTQHARLWRNITSEAISSGTGVLIFATQPRPTERAAEAIAMIEATITAARAAASNYGSGHRWNFRLKVKASTGRLHGDVPTGLRCAPLRRKPIRY
jgi:hypothetical protein